MSIRADVEASLKGERPGRGEAMRSAERAALGCFLLDCRLIHVAKLDGLKPEHFSSVGHRAIYSAMLARTARKEQFDTVVLAADLESDGQLETVGGVTYLAFCLENFDCELVSEYVDLVKRCALERRLSSSQGGR